MKSETREIDRVPTKRKAAWGSGALCDVFMNNAINKMAYPIYNMALNVPPELLGLAMSLPRIWDAFTDPLMGHISDGTKSRWGRRKPYIFIGAILCALFFAMIWMPPEAWSPQAIGIYFLVVSILYYTAYTIFSVPWISMGLELTPDYNERTRVQAFRSFFNQFGGIMVAALWYLSFRLGATQMEGLRREAIFFGAVILICGMLPALFVKETIHVPSKQKIKLFRAIGVTLKNRIFLIVCGITLSVIVGIFIVSPFEVYLQTYYVYGGSQEDASTLNMVAEVFFQIFSLAMVPVISAVATRIGKRWTLFGGIALSILSFVSTWFCFNPELPYLYLASKALAAPGLACVWMLTGSMLADICDTDELNTGLRREGMYTAIYGWLVKLGFSGAFAITGFMVSLAGFDSELKTQPPEVIFNMRLMMVLVPSAILAIAAVLTAIYPITEERAAKTRAELEARRGSYEPEQD